MKYYTLKSSVLCKARSYPSGNIFNTQNVSRPPTKKGGGRQTPNPLLLFYPPTCFVFCKSSNISGKRNAQDVSVSHVLLLSKSWLR